MTNYLIDYHSLTFKWASDQLYLAFLNSKWQPALSLKLKTHQCTLIEQSVYYVFFTNSTELANVISLAIAVHDAFMQLRYIAMCVMSC